MSLSGTQKIGLSAGKTAYDIMNKKKLANKPRNHFLPILWIAPLLSLIFPQKLFSPIISIIKIGRKGAPLKSPVDLNR
jgi:hypothetical protein